MFQLLFLQGVMKQRKLRKNTYILCDTTSHRLDLFSIPHITLVVFDTGQFLKPFPNLLFLFDIQHRNANPAHTVEPSNQQAQPARSARHHDHFFPELDIARRPVRDAPVEDR